jgi:hypothetical protein
VNVVGESPGVLERSRGVYRVDIGQEVRERLYAIVTPSGDRMYSYASRRDAEDEAAVLNAVHASPLAVRAEIARGRRSR